MKKLEYLLHITLITERFCNLAVVWDKEDARNLEQVEGLDSQVMYEFDSMNELQHGDHPDFVITSFEL